MDDALGVGKRVRRLVHVVDGVGLEGGVLGALLENVEDLLVVGICADAVDDGEGELALGDVLAEALVAGVVF